MRCPDCNKFVPYDTEVDPEEDASPEVNDTTFTASYRRVLTCEECGTELKEATIELEHDFSGQIEEPAGEKRDEDKTEHEHVFEIENCDASPTSRTQQTDRNGRPIKSSRYMRSFYGVQCSVEVECECGATAAFEVENDEQASAFEELV